jgi:ligand-binding sensor domain-containing protein
MKPAPVYAFLLLFFFNTSGKGQNKTDPPKENSRPHITSPEFRSVTRSIIEDRKGNIWIATFEGVFRYDGKSFVNSTGNVSSARFFSVLEDRKGNLWFGTIGSGVFKYDGKSFQNFTTSDGLLNNEVGCIYEDKTGTIWFGVNGGASCYDPRRAVGKSFRNYRLNEGSMREDSTGIPFPDFTRPPNEVTSIIEDKTGKFWFGTRGNAFVYDGKTFTAVTNPPFTNVRSIIEDKKGTIWLGGNNGLWRYDGSTFAAITQDFVGYIHEDKKGNIWTSSESKQGGPDWVLSRYEEKSLSTTRPTVTEIKPKAGMLFGILEDTKGGIWFGAGGVYRYDGTSITDFKK